MNPVRVELEEGAASLKLEAELNLIYLKDPTNDNVDQVISSWDKHPEPLLKYVIHYPLNISRSFLIPKAPNPLLASLIPAQTYLSFGSQTYDLDKDIDSHHAVLVVEHDQDYMRIDDFQSYKHIIETLSDPNLTGSPFIYKYQLAESFMR